MSGDERDLLAAVAASETEVASRIDTYAANAHFSLAELHEISGETQANLLYLEKELRLLQPEFEPKGKREVRRYSRADLRMALLVTQLKGRGFKPAQIAAFLQARQGAERAARAAHSEPIITPVIPGLDHVERGRVQVSARLLQMVLEIICNRQPVNNALIAVQRYGGQFTPLSAGQHSGDSLALLDVHAQTAGEAAAMIEQNGVLAGFSMADGEIITRFSDRNMLRDRLRTLALFLLVVGGSYRVMIGIDAVTSEPRLLDVLALLNGETLELTAPLYRALAVTLDMLFVVSGYDQGHNPVRDRVRAPGGQPDVLSVLANFVVVAGRGRWDYCGILTATPGDGLAFSATSTGFPLELYTRAVYRMEGSLPGWVQRLGEAIIINDVIPDDPRFPFRDMEKLEAAAFIPTEHSPELRSRGVMYVAARRRPDKGPAFDMYDEIMLRLFGRMAGEMLGRADLTRHTVAETWRMAVDTHPALGLNELRATLLGQLNAALDSQRDEYLLLFLFRMGAYGELRRMNPKLAEWAMQQMMRRTEQLLAKTLRDMPHATLQMVRLAGTADDSYAALIVPAEAPLRELRDSLSADLRQAADLGLTYEGRELDLVPLVWLLPFAFRDLHEQRQHKGVPRLVDELIERMYGALTVLPFMRKGDDYLRSRDFTRARLQYELATHHDRNNPYLYRHLAECLVGLGLYDRAIEVLKQAVELEPGYPGSYRRMAEAYLAKQAYDSALDQLELAIKRDAGDPALYRLRGQALTLRGARDDAEQALNAFREAMALDSSKGNMQARYLTYIAKAYDRLKQHDQAISWFEQALALDPDNEMVQFDLWLAQHPETVA